MSSQEQTQWLHIPVLAEPLVKYLSETAAPLRRMIDGTLGNGGHTKLMLQANPDLEVLGIDRDPAALERAQNNLREFGSRFTAVHGEFADLDNLAAAHGWDEVDAILRNWRPVGDIIAPLVHGFHSKSHRGDSEIWTRELVRLDSFICKSDKLHVDGTIGNVGETE